MNDFDMPAPVTEPDRQYYFIRKAGEYVLKKSKDIGRPLTFCVTTFGCQMNVRDSEKLSGILKDIGFVKTDNEKNADFVIYNTCTVRENANMRLYGHLGEVKRVKKNNPDRMIALCGCMMQEQKVIDKIKESYSFVDILFGTHNIYKLAELFVKRIMAGRMVVDIQKQADKIVEELPSERKYPFKAGVNIMYGCNNFCSYCIVPYVRGRERSRRPEDIISEIKKLADDGVKEVMLLGQNVNSYGKTLDTPISFASLLSEVEKIDGISRIRFMTSHPKDLSDELILAMQNSAKICRHLHLPLQSGSTAILNKMNRKYTKEQYLKLVDRIRYAMPDISLTTDIIVGFPGETKEDFEDTLDVVRKVRYDSAFTFLYSKRTGTPAATMKDQVPDEVAKERFAILLDEVQKAAHIACRRHEGKVMPALIEEENGREEGLLTGRLDNNLLVHFKGDKSLIGEIVNVRLTECKGFYYLGELAR